MKKFKKLIPAMVMLLIATMLMGTTTYAWFSMNTSVTVTGMEVKAKVSDNIQIAECDVGATAKVADSNFKYGLVKTHAETLLEPVSTIDGVAFFYTSTKNVTANGDAASDVYVAYNHASTDAFDTNYGTTGAKGYVEYAVQLKADNTTSDPKYVNLTQLDLTYGGTAATEKAFRVAVFVDDMGDGSTAASATQSTTNLKTILAMSSSAYYTSGKAVSATDALDTLNAKYGTAANIGTVSARTTKYFKVVVRLWLEGEDTTCTNTTFATLTDKWAFDLTFTLADATGGVAVISQPVTASKVDLSAGPSTGSTAKVVDGASYYEISGNTGYYTTAPSTAVTSASVIYHIDVNNVVTDVTNQCTLPAPTP